MVGALDALEFRDAGEARNAHTHNAAIIARWRHSSDKRVNIQESTPCRVHRATYDSIVCPGRVASVTT
jgi:hypothetical protein